MTHIRDTTLPTQFGPINVSAATSIGRRRNQEDRFVMCPDLFSGEYGFFGIFDGTVKEHASEWVHHHIVEELLHSLSFQRYHAMSQSDKALPANRKLLEQACIEFYSSTDAKLVVWCAERDIHYSSCTSVTVLIHFPTSRMYVAHLGDSHAVIGGVIDSKLQGHSLTRPHKPDDPAELKRIEAAGGCCVYLRSGKPFIRGGDFFQRDLAMQLNYSRAFGGKDLKMYGLSCVPSVLQLLFTGGNGGDSKSFPANVLILGSDGVWDVVDPNTGVNVVVHAQDAYTKFQQSGNQNSRVPSPSEQIVAVALDNHVRHGSSDNVTAVTIFF